MIASRNRPGLEYRKPEAVPRKLDEDKRRAIVAAYKKPLNSLPENEAALFADAARLKAIA